MFRGRGTGGTQRVAAGTASPQRTVSPGKCYQQGVDWLNRNHPFFLTNVLNVGKPQWRQDLDTAAIDFEDADNPLFVFNDEFAQTLQPQEMSFVLAHETMHVVLNHGRLLRSLPNTQIANIAMDAVINDYLAGQGIEPLPWAIRGEQVIGQTAANLPVREVYDRLVHQQRQQEKANEQSDSDDTGDGQSGDEDNGATSSEENSVSSADIEQLAQSVANGGGLLNEHEWVAANADTIEQFAAQWEDVPDDIKELMQDAQPAHVRQAGNGTDSALQEWRETHGVSLAWEQLLKEIDPDILPKPGPKQRRQHPRSSFRQRPRKLGAFPDLLLPVRDPEPKKRGLNVDKGKPSIVMALDTSGSISRTTANEFVGLAKSIPEDKVDLQCCTFTTSAKELNLQKPSFPSGGTDFSCIEKYIQDNFLAKGKPYPKAVVVVTDGDASFRTVSPTAEHAKSWTWLLTENRYSHNLRRQFGSRMHSLSKFVRRG